MNMNICFLINQLFLSYLFFIVTEHVKVSFDTYLPLYFDLYSSLGPDLSSIA